jgi:putative nucleotidyltransferase with HDIG domain
MQEADQERGSANNLSEEYRNWETGKNEGLRTLLKRVRNGLSDLPPGNAAARIALIYFIVSLVWVLTSDTVVSLSIFDGIDRRVLQTVKGSAFIVMTTILIFVFIRKQQLLENKQARRLKEALAANREGYWRTDLERDVIHATSGGDADLGWDAAGTIRNLESWRALVHPDDWPDIDALARSNAQTITLEQRFRTSEGGWHWYQIKGQVKQRDSNGKIAIIEGTYHSINRLKLVQTRLENTNMALNILLQSYEVAVDGNSSAIMQRIVNRLAAIPTVRVTWFGEAMNDDEKSFRVISAAGPAVTYIDQFNPSWGGRASAIGPSGKCIKLQKPCMVEDVRTAPELEPWRDLFERKQMLSGVSIPIGSPDGRQYILHVASSIAGQFSSDDTDIYRTISHVLGLIISSADIQFRYAQSESARADLTSRLQRAGEGAISALVTVVESRDPYTAGHQQRVAEIASAIAQEMGLPPEKIEGIRIGAMIHDIGKVGVPAEFLVKPGVLDPSELALIKRHAEIGYHIVKNIDFGWPVERIVHEHHERWDGSGYPRGLTGKAIALEARIVAVADVVESMATNRPYRERIPWIRVLQELETGRNSRYDPDVVDAAFSVLDRNATPFGLTTN